MQIQSKYDIIIVGGGVYGLSIAYYLSKNQNLKIALLQQYAIGHNKGSSHSTTRITRSLYEKQIYRDLNMQCLSKNWPQLQKALQSKFVHPNEFIYFDDNQDSYQNYRKVAHQSGPQNAKICQTYDQFRQYFKAKKTPQIQSKYPPIIDKKAGIIYASLYIKKLHEYLTTQCQNVAVMEHTAVKSIVQNKKQLSIETQTQILRANQIVLACGQWITQIAPETAQLFQPVKQFVSFLELQPQSQFHVGKFPSFAYNTKNGQFYYSAPCDTHQKLGLKLAQHKYTQPPNPDHIQKTIDFNYQELRKKAMEYFGEDLVRVKMIEECVYTNTKSSDFVIDWVGESEKILICSCCSGHGFKFSPIIGEIISQILSTKEEEESKTEKKVINEVFNKWKHIFKIAYHQGINLS